MADPDHDGEQAGDLRHLMVEDGAAGVRRAKQYSAELVSAMKISAMNSGAEQERSAEADAAEHKAAGFLKRPVEHFACNTHNIPATDRRFGMYGLFLG